MKPIIQSKNDISESHNGLGFLNDCISCVVSEELNGMMELELVYPIEGVLSEHLINENVLKVKANEEQAPQLFRIYNITKNTEPDRINVQAKSITHDLEKCFIEKLEVKDSSGMQAMKALMELSNPKHKFQLTSSKTNKGSTLLERKNVLECIAGTEGSILQKWQGELTRDNYSISLDSKRGRETPLVISSGKNLTGIDMEIDTSNIVVAIYPFAIKEEKLLFLSEKIIKSDKYDTFASGKVIAVDFSSDETVSDTGTLKLAAYNYFKENKPEAALSIDIEFIDRSYAEQDSKFKYLERVYLGDTINAIDGKLDIKASGRVVSYEYDSLVERYNKVIVGKIKSNFADNLNGKVDDITEKIPDKNFIDAIIEHQTDLITGNKGGSMVIRYSDEGLPNELLFMDTEDVNTALKVLRINKNGIGFSKNGVDGSYGTAWTLDGTFNANYITTGIIKGANLEINLTSGEVTFQKGIIQRADKLFSIDVTKGIIESYDNNGGFTIAKGEITLNSSPALTTGNSKKFGTITYKWLSGGLWTFTSGLALIGEEGCLLGTSNARKGFSTGERNEGAGFAGSKKGEISIFSKESIELSAGNLYENVPGESIFKNLARLSLGNIDNNGNSIIRLDARVIQLVASGYKDHFLLSSDSTSSYVRSLAMYGRTYSNAPNLYITGLGTIGRSTSASKYKLAIEEDFSDNYKNILKLKHKTWYDKSNTEAYASALDKKESFNWDNPEDEVLQIERIHGFIAEDLVEAGLTEFVTYGETKEDGTKEVEGIQYDRLVVPLLQIVKDHQKEIEKLKERIK